MGIRLFLDYHKFSYRQLMLYGVHVGHSFINSLFYTAWLVYSYTQNILILNLFKSIKGMKSGLASLIGSVGSYQPTWFINLDQAAGISVRFLAMACGEFSATSFWINGFISNYNSVYNTFRKLRKMSWFSYPTRNKNAIDSYKLWYLTRCTWPRTIFISNVCSSYQPAKESLHLGIPCIGIVDSNTYTHVVSIPVPGNDDSLDCLVFYNDFISKFILLRKYSLILTWFLDTRKSSRLSTFKEWLKNKLSYKQNLFDKKKEKIKLLSFIKFRFNFLKNIHLGMSTLFAQNYKYSLRNFEYLDIFKNSIVKNNESIDSVIIWKKKMLRFLNKYIKPFNDLKSFYYNKKLWFTYHIVRNRFLNGTYFRLNLFTYDYFETHIKIDRFYKTHIRWSFLNTPYIIKFYKFFVIYNFSRFKQLSTNIFPQSMFNSVFFKLISEQLFPKGNNTYDVNLYKTDNNINFKNFSSFSMKNLYTLYHRKDQRLLLSKLFRLFNKRFWLKMSDYSRKRYLRQLKFMKYFSRLRPYIRKLNLNKLDSLLFTIMKTHAHHRKVFRLFLVYFMANVLRKIGSCLRLKKRISSYYKSIRIKIKRIKYDFIIKKFLNFFYNNLPSDIYQKSKGILFLFILNLLGFYKFVEGPSISLTKLFIKKYVFDLLLSYFDKKGIKRFSYFYNLKKRTRIYLNKINPNIKSFYIFKTENTLYNMQQHPFLLLIKSEYKDYLSKNPYTINSLDYWTYVNYSNFLKYKKSYTFNNYNWRFFYKFGTNNRSNFFRDFFLRQKNITLNKPKLFSFNNNNNFFNKNYLNLGWTVFNKPITKKSWLYSREFFLFPSWFYNFEKNRNYFFNWNYRLLNKKLAKIAYYKRLSSRINRLLTQANLNKKFIFFITSYINISLDPEISPELKKDYLLYLKISLFKLVPLKTKLAYTNSIRFNKKLIWKIKADKLDNLDKIIDSSLTNKGRYAALHNIWNTKRYNLFWKEKKVYEKMKFFHKLSVEDRLRYNNIKLLINNNRKWIFNLKYKRMPIIKNLNILLFNNKYKYNLLNKYSISSTLNNFFFRYYNVPRLLNFNNLITFVKFYKIYLRLRYKKNNRKHNKIKSTYLAINKAGFEDYSINITQFLRTYGLQWF